MNRAALAAVVLVATAGAAAAFDFAPLKPLGLKEVDPAMLKDAFGAYEIRDKAGRKRCRLTLSREPAIGAMAIDVAPDCAKLFPVMADVAGWRLLEGWTIDLIDPLRKTIIRFETPDSRYVPFGDPTAIAGIAELRKMPESPSKKRQ